MSYLDREKWHSGKTLDDDDKLAVQTSITVTSLMAMLSIAQNLELMVGEMQRLQEAMQNLDQNLYSAIVK